MSRLVGIKHVWGEFIIMSSMTPHKISNLWSPAFLLELWRRTVSAEWHHIQASHWYLSLYTKQCSGKSTPTLLMQNRTYIWPEKYCFGQGWESPYKTCVTCGTCVQYSTATPKEPMRSLPTPKRPWQIVNQDICELHNQSYLVTVRLRLDWGWQAGRYHILHSHRGDRSPLCTIWC